MDNAKLRKRNQITAHAHCKMQQTAQTMPISANGLHAMRIQDAVAAACIIMPIATAMPASVKCLMLNALQKSLFGLPKQTALHFNTGRFAV